MSAIVSIIRKAATVAAGAGVALALAAGTATAETPAGADAQQLHDHVVGLENDVANDLNTFWSGWFESQGLGFKPPTPILVDSGQVWETQCPDESGSFVSSDYQNAFFCATDNTIVMPVDAMVTMLQTGQFNSINDPSMTNFDVALLLAHEYGHAVQYQLQADHIEMSAGLESTTRDGRPSPLPELFADCAAGVWTTDVGQRGWLEDGDVESGLRAMWQLGDESADEAMPHGTPEQRKDAFSTGVQAGDLETCFQAYIA